MLRTFWIVCRSVPRCKPLPRQSLFLLPLRFCFSVYLWLRKPLLRLPNQFRHSKDSIRQLMEIGRNGHRSLLLASRLSA